MSLITNCGGVELVQIMREISKTSAIIDQFDAYSRRLRNGLCDAYQKLDAEEEFGDGISLDEAHKRTLAIIDTTKELILRILVTNPDPTRN